MDKMQKMCLQTDANCVKDGMAAGCHINLTCLVLGVCVFIVDIRGILFVLRFHATTYTIVDRNTTVYGTANKY